MVSSNRRFVPFTIIFEMVLNTLASTLQSYKLLSTGVKSSLKENTFRIIICFAQFMT